MPCCSEALSSPRHAGVPRHQLPRPDHHRPAEQGVSPRHAPFAKMKTPSSVTTLSGRSPALSSTRATATPPFKRFTRAFLPIPRIRFLQEVPYSDLVGWGKSPSAMCFVVGRQVRQKRYYKTDLVSLVTSPAAAGMWDDERRSSVGILWVLLRMLCLLWVMSYREVASP
jgi:hypothetical protein